MIRFAYNLENMAQSFYRTTVNGLTTWIIVYFILNGTFHSVIVVHSNLVMVALLRIKGAFSIGP